MPLSTGATCFRQTLCNNTNSTIFPLPSLRTAHSVYTRLPSTIPCTPSHSLLLLHRHCRSGSSRVSPPLRASSSSSSSSPTPTHLDAESILCHALLLAYHASQNKSLFAAKCLVETAVEIYRRGYSLDDIKLTVTLATLATSDPLKPIMLEILLTWSAVVMMTLKAVGVPLYDAPETGPTRDHSSEEHEDRMTQSLEFFVKSCIDRFLSGTDLFRLQLQQSMQQPLSVEDPDAGGESPTVAVLQQNARLAIITLQVVRDMGLPTSIPLKQKRAGEEEEDEDTNASTTSTSGNGLGTIGYVNAFVCPQYFPNPPPPSHDNDNDNDNDDAISRAARIRASAIKLLISFNGAALGYLRPARSFVETAMQCYLAGWTADEIYTSLHDDEFAQSGGVSRITIYQMPPEITHISATLFARWISLTYMTLAQLAVPHPGASEQDAWAMVKKIAGASGVPAGLEAHAVAEFVGSTLRIAAQSDDESGGDEEARAAGGRRWTLGGVKSEEVDVDEECMHEGFTAGRIEDPSLLQTSSFALILSQEISLVRLTRVLVLERRRAAVEYGMVSELS